MIDYLKNRVNEVDTKNIITTWEKLGLLEGIDKEDEIYKKVALLYNECAKWLLKDDNIKYYQDIECMIFPFVRCLLEHFPIKYDYNIDELFKIILKYNTIFGNFLSSQINKTGIDLCAEIIKYTATLVYLHFTNDEKYKINTKDIIFNDKFKNEDNEKKISLFTMIDGYNTKYHIVEGKKIFDKYDMYIEKENQEQAKKEVEQYIPGMEKVLPYMEYGSSKSLVGAIIENFIYPFKF